MTPENVAVAFATPSGCSAEDAAIRGEARDLALMIAELCEDEGRMA